MKHPLYTFFFIFCVLALSLPLEAQAQVTITNSQARGGQSTEAPRFTPSQMASRWGGAHQSQEKQPNQAGQPNQTGQTGQNQMNQPATQTPQSPEDSQVPVTTAGSANETPTTQATSDNTVNADPETPPQRGPNAVITITPSTALKSGSPYSQHPDDAEEKSVTSWSSDATKAIIHYQEPTEPKPSTGAPQLRLLD